MTREAQKTSQMLGALFVKNHKTMTRQNIFVDVSEEEEVPNEGEPPVHAIQGHGTSKRPSVEKGSRDLNEELVEKIGFL